MKSLSPRRQWRDRSDVRRLSACRQRQALLPNYYVYRIDSLAGVPVYIGKGRGKRYRDRAHRSERIKALILAGLTREPVIIRDNLTKEEAYALEVELIAWYGRECDGGSLLNRALGGPGASGAKYTLEAKANLRAAITSRAYREKQRAAQTGRKHTPETKEKMAAAKRGKPLSEEHRANVSLSQRGKRASDETRAKISAAHTGRKRDRAKMSAIKRGKPLSAEHRAKIAAAHQARREQKTESTNKGES